MDVLMEVKVWTTCLLLAIFDPLTEIVIETHLWHLPIPKCSN